MPRARACRCGCADRRRRAPAPPWSAWSRVLRCQPDGRGPRLITLPAASRTAATGHGPAGRAFSIGDYASLPRRDRRLGSLRILRRGLAAQSRRLADDQLDVRRRHAGDAADAVGFGALRGRARSPEDQVDQQAIREDRRATRGSGSSATSWWASTSARPNWPSSYDAVVYAIGAQADRPLNIPGEELPGSVAAVDFVGWYNAHPHFEEISPDLSGAPGRRRRQRQRRARRRAHSGHRPRRARPHRHRRPRAGVAAPARRRGSGRHRSPRPAADRVHHAGAA